MRLSRRILSLATSIVAAAGVVVAGSAPASAAALPAHVFAPYFEAWTGESPAALAQQSGAKYLTMAFLQAATKGSCTAYWNGDTGMPISSSTFGGDFTTIRANGGDVIASFGGFTADNTGTEIADSCTNVSSIAAVFQNLITTYNISRIDLDIEDNSLTNTAGIDRRNKAVKQVEDWAAANGRTIQFSYTLPTTTQGLADNGLAVLRNAIANNARIDVVNMMTFDYYDNQPHNMATDTQTSGSAQSVSLSVSGAPAGVTASVSPATVNAGASATLSVSTTSAAVAGSYPITVSGNAASGSHSATFTLTVNGTVPTGSVVNGGFEAGLSPWVAPGDTVVTSPAHSGTHALQVAATSSQTGEATQAITLAPNKSYTLKAWVQGNFAFIGVTGGASASVWTSAGTWTQVSLPFTTGASGAVNVFVHGWYGQGTVYADDISVS
jgi:hypothetical protein